MKGMNKMIMAGSAVMAGLMMMSADGAAQQLSQSALLTIDGPQSSRSLTSDEAADLALANEQLGASSGMLLSTEGGNSVLLVDVDGTMEDLPFSGLMSIDRFEKRGKRIYAVGHMVETSTASSVVMDGLSGLPEFQSSGMIDYRELDDAAFYAYAENYDWSEADFSGSFDYDTLGWSELESSSPNFLYEDLSAGMYDDIIDLSYSGRSLYDTRSGLYYENDYGFTGLTETELSDRFLYDTLGRGGFEKSTVGLGYMMRPLRNIGSVSPSLDVDTWTTSYIVSEVAVPIAITGASCDGVYLTLGPSEKPSVGNVYHGVTPDAGMEKVSGTSVVKISSSDLASAESSESLCRLSSLVSGNGSTHAIVEQLNNLVGGTR